MGAGAWVFPIGIIAFLAYLTSFLAGHPATPPAFVQPGDTVLVETTQFYGDGYVTFTTREDLYTTGQLKLSPYGASLDPQPTNVTVPLDANRGDPSVIAQLIGHRLNETFTTAKVPDFYGRFTETKTIDPTIFTFPTLVTVQAGASTPEGPFNYTRFVARWTTALGHPLQVGDTFACESGVPWQCRVERLDATSQTVAYRRTVKDGDEVSPSLVFAFAQGTPAPKTNLTTKAVSQDQVALLWLPQPGESFVLQQATASWAAGAYRVESVDNAGVHVRYNSNTQSQGGVAPAHLIGEEVWFELTIVRIIHRAG